MDQQDARKAIDSMSDLPARLLRNRPLDPMDRISEILFGLIMVLTFTSSIGIVTGDRAPIRVMLIGALGCNLAWGIIDAGLYLLGCLNEQGRNLLALRTVRTAPDPAVGQRAIADALPPVLASVVAPEQLEQMRLKLRELPDTQKRPRLTKEHWAGALGVFLLVFLCTFPVVIPFMVMTDAELALRVSNAVAVAMLFLCGYAFGHHSGLAPWPTGLAMVFFGIALVGVAIALEG